MIDFQANIPSHDLTLIAPTTQLVARSDLHPALVHLFIQTAEKVHKSGGIFYVPVAVQFHKSALGQGLDKIKGIGPRRMP